MLRSSLFSYRTRPVAELQSRLSKELFAGNVSFLHDIFEIPFLSAYERLLVAPIFGPVADVRGVVRAHTRTTFGGEERPRRRLISDMSDPIVCDPTGLVFHV